MLAPGADPQIGCHSPAAAHGLRVHGALQVHVARDGRPVSRHSLGRRGIPDWDAMNTTPQTASHTRFSGLSLNTFLLAFASFFADISTEMQYPVLPTFLTQTLGADGTIVGLIDGCAQALQNV